jgi:hypothetical protein
MNAISMWFPTQRLNANKAVLLGGLVVGLPLLLEALH